MSRTQTLRLSACSSTGNPDSDEINFNIGSITSRADGIHLENRPSLEGIHSLIAASFCYLLQGSSRLTTGRSEVRTLVIPAYLHPPSRAREASVSPAPLALRLRSASAKCNTSSNIILKTKLADRIFGSNDHVVSPRCMSNLYCTMSSFISVDDPYARQTGNKLRHQGLKVINSIAYFTVQAACTLQQQRFEQNRGLPHRHQLPRPLPPLHSLRSMQQG